MEKQTNTKTLEENKKYSLGHRFAFGALISLFLSFTILFCAPLTLYVEGANDLWFTFKAILIPVIIIFVIGFIVFTLIASLPPKTIQKIICALMFGVALGLYVQGTYANISYGDSGLNGSEIIWSDFTKYGIIDTAIWIICLAIPFVLLFCFKKYFRTILMGASVCLVLIQIITLTTYIISNQEALTKVTYTVTDDGIYELSSEENTLVFVLDAFDQEYLDQKFEEHPEYKDIFQGFTEYTNCLSSGSRTIEGVPSMLTGTEFKKETTYAQYIDKIWNDETAYTDMKNMGVDSRLYVEPTFIGKNAGNSINNIVDIENGIGSYKDLTKTMYKYTLFAYSPHYAKRFFWIDTADFSKSLPDNVFKEGDAKFYANFNENGGFTYKDDYSKALRLYSMEGAHTPYTLTKDATRSDKTSLSEQLDGCFKYLQTFFDNMKENKVYENSTIIITADHGDKEPNPCHPIMLVKEKGSSKDLKQSNAPISAFDLLPTLAKSVGISDYSTYATGKAFDDYKEDDQRDRYYYNNTGANADARVDEYLLANGLTSYQKDKLQLIQSYYTNGGVVEKYKLGTELSFEIDATANIYCKDGFRQTTGFRTPLAGPHSEMEIPIDSIPNDTQNLILHLGIHNIDNGGHMVSKANGTTIYDDTITYDNNAFKPLNLIIPRSAIGEDNVLNLTFDFDYIDSSELNLDVPNRTMTISFKTIMIEAQ